MIREEIEATAADVRAAGEALRGAPLEERVQAAAAVLDAWNDPKGRWQEALVPALARAADYSEANVRAGLALGLADWTGGALRALVARELPTPSSTLGFEATSIVLAGSIPMPSLLQPLLSLVLGSSVLMRPGARDPVTADLVSESLRVEAPLLAPALRVVRFDHRDDAAAQSFFASECVVASGADETLRAIAARVAPWQRWVAYGHRLSVGVLGPDALADPRGTAAACSLDVTLWDQLGCLSPIALYLVDCSAAASRAFAEALARALDERERELPRGAISTATAAAIQHEREAARFRSANSDGTGALLASSGTLWTVALECDALPRDAPLHRFVRLHPVAGSGGLDAALAPLRRHLSTAAVAGFGDSDRAIEMRLLRVGASRTCAPGRMQAPPLGWPHDGAEVLSTLARRARSTRRSAGPERHRTRR